MKKRTNPEGYMTTPKERQSYWNYFVGQNAYYYLTATFLSTYLAMQGVSLAKVAVVLLIVKIWDAVNDPLFGFLFDRIEFKNGLKSLPWLRVSVVLMPIVTIAVFSIPGFLGETGKLIWFGATYVLWDTVYTLTDAPAYAMLNTMTDNVQERTTLLSINRIYSGLGQGICGAVLTLLISEKIGLSASWSVAILAILAGASMVPLCVNCKERNYKPGETGERFTFRQMFTYLAGNKYLLIYYLGYCAMDALKTSNAVGLFASFYLFGSANFNLLLGLLASIPGFFAAAIAPKLLKKIRQAEDPHCLQPAECDPGLCHFSLRLGKQDYVHHPECDPGCPRQHPGRSGLHVHPRLRRLWPLQDRHQRHRHYLRHPDLLREDHRRHFLFPGSVPAGAVGLGQRSGLRFRRTGSFGRPAERPGYERPVDRICSDPHHRPCHRGYLLSVL